MKKFRLNTVVALILSAGLFGCTVDGKIEVERNKKMICKDTRDGETFSFNTNSVTNARLGIGADHSFDVTDNNGKKRTLTSNMEAYLKCEEAK